MHRFKTQNENWTPYPNGSPSIIWVTTVTTYRRDAFGRVVEETVTKTPDTLYHVFYKYAGADGGGCGSCAGGSASQVAVKMITNADQTTTETLTFKYDLLGRLVSSNESNFDATTSYTYDFAEHDGTRLTEIDQDTSYEGDDKVRYEYDEHNRLKREIGNIGLTGKGFDQIAGGYDFGFRMFDSERGRFLSLDPMGPVDGPNMYAFVSNDPDEIFVNQFYLKYGGVAVEGGR